MRKPLTIVAGMFAAAAGIVLPASAASARPLHLSAATTTPTDQVQQIATTNVPKGAHTFNFASTVNPFYNAEIAIDRTVKNGLNSAPLGSTLSIDIQYSLDGGATWTDMCGGTLQGGTFVTKGQTWTTDTLACSRGFDFPTGTLFNVITTASQTMAIAGTVTYTDNPDS